MELRLAEEDELAGAALVLAPALAGAAVEEPVPA